MAQQSSVVIRWVKFHKYAEKLNMQAHLNAIHASEDFVTIGFAMWEHEEVNKGDDKELAKEHAKKNTKSLILSD